MLKAQALDGFGSSHAICNVLYGAQAVFDPYMAAAFCRAINDWIAAEWLARDTRLRASIVVPMQAPDLAVEEIERLAGDPRFVVDPGPGAGRDPARPPPLLARLSRPPSATSCRSPSIREANTAWRRARSAGRPIGWSTTSPRRRRIRRSC